MEKRIVNYDAKTGDTIAVNQLGQVVPYRVENTYTKSVDLVMLEGDPDEVWAHVSYEFLRGNEAYYVLAQTPSERETQERDEPVDTNCPDCRAHFGAGAVPHGTVCPTCHRGTVEAEQWFINYYRHEDCPQEPGVEWEDEWSAMCDDECPTCEAPISPYKSEDAKTGEEVL